MLEHERDYSVVREFAIAESKLLVNRLARAQDVARRKLHLLQKPPQFLLVEWLYVVVDFLKRDAALTEQPVKLTTFRSSRFFVNNDLIFHRLNDSFSVAVSN